MRSTVIVTAATGSPTWAGPCIASQAALAIRYGADFHLATHGLGESGEWGPSNYWTKLHAIRRVLSSGHKYEHIVWMDADMMVNLDAFEDQDWKTLVAPVFGVALDPLAVMDKRFMEWATKRSGLPPCSKVAEGVPYYNAGLMSMARNMAELLVMRWETTPHEPGLYWDQDLLNYHIACDGYPLTVLPKSLNWMCVRAFGDTLRDARILHFSGLQKAMIAPVARMMGLS